MNIVLNPNLNVPLNEQVYSQIVRGIALGEIKAGECLPSIRFVARELGIGIITVKIAYEKLEAVSPEKLRLARFKDRLSGEVAYARALGVGEDEFISLVRDIYKNNDRA